MLSCDRVDPRCGQRIGQPPGLDEGPALAHVVEQGDARQLPHEQPKIERADVHEQALQDVGMPAQMRPAHAPRFEQMGEGALDPFAAVPEQALPAGPRIRRRLAYTASRAAALPRQLRRPRSGSEM